jgi:predicted HAD superfamily hydrolase
MKVPTIFEKDFLEKLDNDNIKVISFDIFDTLFFRKCLLPENIFEVVGNVKYVRKYFDTANTFKKYRMYAEKNARITHKNKQEITLDEIYEEFFIPKRIKEKIKQIELNIEKEFLVVNYDLVQWIDFAVDKGKKIILISDMYLNQEQLKFTCLKKLKNIEKISKIYVSNEYKLTKAKGDLFLKVLEEENIKCNEILHIGDNKISDNLIPKTLNINTLYYGFSEKQEMALDYERTYVNIDIMKGNNARKLAMMRNPYEESFENFYFDFGASIFGPIFFEFSHWLNDLSKSHKIEQYNFIMREGFIFEKFFKKLFPEKRTNLVYASRNSTFPMTLDLDNISSVLLGTQRAFSINDLYEESLQISIKNKKVLPYKNELLSKASSINIEGNTLYEIIVEDLFLRKDEIVKKNNEQKGFIKEYFTNLNIDKNSILIDFGAGGTILNRIREILPKKQNPKIYALFFQNERGYKLQSKNQTLSFLPYTKKSSESIETIARSPEIFEILLNLDLETTINYSKIEDKIVPNTFLPFSNRDTICRIKDSFLEGINCFFDTAKLYDLRNKSYDRDFLSQVLSRVINLPTKFEVKEFGVLENDEGNGTAHIYKIVDEEKIEIIKNYGLEKMYFEYQKNKAKYRHVFPWFESVITTINPYFLINNYKELTKDALNYQIIIQLLEQIDSMEEKEFIIYGAGELFKELIPHLQDRRIKITSVIDSRAELQEFEVLGYKITTLSKALLHQSQANIIIASGAFVDKIKDNIIDFSKKNNKYIKIFSI